MNARWPRAIFGGPLLGHKPVRYIYVDEAGISQHEEILVVVGVIVDADRQWKAAHDALVGLVRDRVPKSFQDGFLVHAKSIWGNPKYREGWSIEERIELLKGVARLPKTIGLPLAMGMQRKGNDLDDLAKKASLRPEQFQHCMAFGTCVTRADEMIRNNAPESEVATLIVEDVPDIKQALRSILRGHQSKVIQIPPNSPPLSSSGAWSDNGGIFHVSRIVDGVHFVEKRDAPLLQIADVCAFAFRSFFSNQRIGKELISSVVDSDLSGPEWLAPMNGAVFGSWPK